MEQTVTNPISFAEGEGKNSLVLEELPTRTTPSKPVDFEVAIDEAGFGIFNILLLLAALPCIMANYFETSAMSYIFASAECDLQLTLTDKGLLNAVTYVGMICSAIFWGLIADAKGRKKAIIIGYLVDVILVIGGAASQNVYQLMVFKLIGGFVMSGPLAVLITYISELHGKKYRPRIMMMTGSMFSISSLALPLLAIAILPNDWNFQLFGLQVHPWQIFLVATATPSLAGGLLFCLFPESPKFLMSKGRNKEALKVFQQIYALNRRKPKEDYAVKVLVNELTSGKDEDRETRIMPVATITSSTGDSTLTAPSRAKTIEKKSLGREIWDQTKPLFKKPYLRFSLQISLMSFVILLGQNTMRLWLPQLFASIEEYKTLTGDASSMCEILAYSVNKTIQIVEQGPNYCEVVITVETYLNNLTVGVVNLLAYVLVSVIVNYCDVKWIMNSALIASSCCAIGLYFASSGVWTVVAAALYTASGSISSTSLLNSSLNIFPTSLRTLIASMNLMIGRVGSIVGNVLFSEFMKLGCIPPFLMISLAMLMACLLGLFLPSTNKLSLK